MTPPGTRLDLLVGDAEIAELLSDEAELAAMLWFESALAAAQADAGLVPSEAAGAIAEVCRTFVPVKDQLAAGMIRDGLVVPALVATLRASLAEPHRKWLHFGATSQDVIDTALVVRLKTISTELDKRIEALLAAFQRLQAGEGSVRLMAQTRMQQALPFTASDKIEAWTSPLLRHRMRLAELSPRLMTLQFGGPIGVRGGLDGKGNEIARNLANRLGLSPGPVWHSARDAIAEFAGWLALVTGSLGKIGQDLALMVQNEIGAVKLAGGGTSSAMPHKSNPVVAEILVAQARFNAGMLGTLHQSLVHENERSGAAWTLEWMVLPQMAITTGAALRHANALIGGLHFVGKRQGIE